MSDLQSILSGSAASDLDRAHAEQQLVEVSTRRAELEANRMLIEHIRVSYYLTPLQWRMSTRNPVFMDMEALRSELHAVKRKQLELDAVMLDQLISEITAEIKSI